MSRYEFCKRTLFDYFMIFNVDMDTIYDADDTLQISSCVTQM